MTQIDSLERVERSMREFTRYVGLYGFIVAAMAWTTPQPSVLGAEEAARIVGGDGFC